MEGGIISTRRLDFASHPSYRWYLVAMLWTIGFLNYADRQAIFSVFPLLQSKLHLSLTELGLLGSAFAWAYGLCAPFAGYLVDRIRRTVAVVGGLELWSLLCALTVFAQSLWPLTILRCSMGIGESLYFPASLSMMSDYHGPETRSRALGLHQTSVYAGTIMGGFFAGWLAEHYGWQTPFACFGVAGVLLGIGLIYFLVEPQRGASDPQFQRLTPEALAALSEPQDFWYFPRLALRTPSIWLLMAAFACANFVAVVLLVWMPAYLYKSFHLNLAMSGLTATALAQIGSIGGTTTGGWLADLLTSRLRCGRVLIQAFGVLIGAPFVYFTCRTHVLMVLMVCLALWGFFKGLYDANIFASLYDNIPIHARGVATGWMNTVGWLGGGGLAPLLVGWWAAKHGLGVAMGMAAVVYVLAGALLLLAALLMLSKRTRQTEVATSLAS